MARIKERDRKARNEAIIASYNITHNISATAEETGVSRETCKKALVAAGIDTKAVRTQDRLSKQPDRKPKANKKDNRLKPISMYTVNNEFVCDFASVSHALEYLRQQGFPKATLQGISYALQCNRATAYGYKWRYQNEKLNKAPYQYKKRRPVHMYTLSGEYVRTFPNPAAAAKQLNIGVSHIRLACAGTYHIAGGYQWRYADTENQIPENISSFKQERPGKAITMCSLSGEELKTFHSATAAAEYLASVGLSTSAISAKRTLSYTINGKCKTAYGYKWRPAALH